MQIRFPRVYAVDTKILKNPVQRIHALEQVVAGTCEVLADDDTISRVFTPEGGGKPTLLRVGRAACSTTYENVISCAEPVDAEEINLSCARWISHRGIVADGSAACCASMATAVLESWRGAFDFHAATKPGGLRTPQMGALYAALSHWSTSVHPATIVMPTGTGKTDAMLSILVVKRFKKVLVVVPTDALRQQLAEKFLTLGILKRSEEPILAPHALFPVVGTLRHKPKDSAEVDAVFQECQIVVTTSQIIGRCTDEVRNRVAGWCDALFVDEAHHGEALTWRAFRDAFAQKIILQFTATPFREDGKRLEGQIIYKYSLKQAQEEEYFKPIRFEQVFVFGSQQDKDEAIAGKAIEALRASLHQGHILMARAEDVKRATDIYEIYKRYPDLQPVLLHSRINGAHERARLRELIQSGACRIIVCVDMLGEGFDLPELKIAAFHDIRKSLSVTLQIAGRFTRARAGLGEAVFIANTAEVVVREELQRLYAHDPDWNLLLPQLSEQMIDSQVDLQQFVRGFVIQDELAAHIQFKDLRLAASAVVYKTKCEHWNPERFRFGYKNWNEIHRKTTLINAEKRTLVVVMARKILLNWTRSEDIFDWVWEIITVHWSPELNLLFINSGSNSGDYKNVAKQIAGDEVELIQGEDVFRTLSGIHRLRLQSVGLTERLGRNVSYVNRMGTSVAHGITERQRSSGSKSVIAGYGYEHGSLVTVGASKRGRVWSHQRVSIDALIRWCEGIGRKLTDPTINTEAVLEGTLVTTAVSQRPAEYPCYITWPEEVLIHPESFFSLYAVDGREWELHEADIDLMDPSETGSLRFQVSCGGVHVPLELQFRITAAGDADFLFEYASPVKMLISRGESSERADAEDLCSYLNNFPPVIWFANGASLEGNQYTPLKNMGSGFDVGTIEVWDWSGVDIRVESQEDAKLAHSIQFRVIARLKAENVYDVIVDDDGSGEVADVVAFRSEKDQAGIVRKIHISLYHCKFSHEDRPGARIADLYEVCGQAQKSLKWMSYHDRKQELMTRLMRRDAQRISQGRSSHFELGDARMLQKLRDQSAFAEIDFHVFVVQPGLSKAAIMTVRNPDLHTLLGVTRNHLGETYDIPFHVIANE